MSYERDPIWVSQRIRAKPCTDLLNMARSYRFGAGVPRMVVTTDSIFDPPADGRAVALKREGVQPMRNITGVG